MQPQAAATTPERIIAAAHDLLGTPWMQGGEDPDQGLDAWGYARAVLIAATGNDRLAKAGSRSGWGLSTLFEAQRQVRQWGLAPTLNPKPGDLVLFDRTNDLRGPGVHIKVLTATDGPAMRAHGAMWGKSACKFWLNDHWLKAYAGAFTLIEADPVADAEADAMQEAA